MKKPRPVSCYFCREPFSERERKLYANIAYTWRGGKMVWAHECCVKEYYETIERRGSKEDENT